MQKFDLIVIGAGPAGSTAAETAARAGLNVALIEKHKLPRHKTCGGGMPMSVGSVVKDLAPEACIEATVTHMRHTWKFGDPVLAKIEPGADAPKLSLWMVQRSQFDNTLTQRAVKAGACLIDGLAVRSIEQSGGMVTVRAAGMNEKDLEVRAPYVIGADGANGVTARIVGLRKHRMLAIGQEIEHLHCWGEGHPDLRPEIIHLEYGAVPRGYAWVFPKGDHLNIGAGIFRPRKEDGRGHEGLGEELRMVIYRYMDSLGIKYDRERLKFYAHPLPIWNGKETLQSQDSRVLLAGDAAGLINPIFGDGILNAIKSGVIGANSVAEGRADQYTLRIHEIMADNMDAALNLSKVFYQFTGPIFKHGIHRPGSTTAAARLLSGEAMFTDVSSRAMNMLRRSIGHRMYQKAAASEP